MAIDEYYLLGRSGLRVSRLALGTMNFGTRGYHAPYGKTLDESRPILRTYLDAGGNFIDTADFYTDGESETILGQLLAETGARDSVVLTTKFTNAMYQGTRTAAGTAASSWCARWRTHCADCAPITSTSTCCTRGTG